MIRFLFFSWIFLVVLILTSCEKWEDEEPNVLKIGVMLPFTGEYASDWDDGLDWAVENINQAGGVAGYNVKLVKRDLNEVDIADVSKEFIHDKSIKAVIGPLTSSSVYQAAPLFISAQKLLIAPVATAANISKAFSAYEYFWRLTEPDISQVKTQILLAQKGGAQKIALITEETQYGASFEDWFGYFATELGLEVTGIKVVSPGDLSATKSAWDAIVAQQPDAVISAINLPSQNIDLVKAYREKGQQTRLLMSDAAVFQTIIDELGEMADNLEGTMITSFPESGFDAAYYERYNKYPNAFVGHMYDAVMLLGLALEASGGQGGGALVEALKKVVNGREGSCSWQCDDMKSALSEIRSGVYPDVNGTSGSLDYDELNYTDVTSTTYGHWSVNDNKFLITEYFTSDGSGRVSSTSAAYRTIAEQKQEFSKESSWPTLASRDGLYALLMATSHGWNNYRHQADVLQTYQLLKSNGLSDDRIILILADDLVLSDANPLNGVVRNRLYGENLYEDVNIDYKLSEISVQNLKDILTGNKTEETPIVLSSGAGDNVLFFTSGHGTLNGMALEVHDNTMLTPVFWNDLFEQMYEKQNYRQLFWVLESCYSGRIGEAIRTPGVMLMTGANSYETSKSYMYDSELKNWLANKFAYSVNNAIQEVPEITFSELYERSYIFVNGSHVSFYNYKNFGNIYELSLKDFITP